MTSFTSHDRVLSAYRDRLAGLAGMKGQRNASLLGLCNLGIMAGLPDGQLEQEIKDASGTPPLTLGEIRHALRTARRDTVPLNDRDTPARRWTPPPKPKPPLGPGARDYVARMIERGKGATLESLAACSPVLIPAAPHEQVWAFMWALYDHDALLFCGDATDRGRIGQTIRSAWDWRAAFRSGERLPALLIANPLTGREARTKEGKLSFRCGACVAARRHVLVEFDAMPLEEQARFWAGVIASRTLPLQALTFSGGKSLHGLVRIDAPTPQEWEHRIDKLLFAVANPEAPPEYQADRACRNADRLTRLPGATRPDKGTVQVLVWLAAPWTR